MDNVNKTLYIPLYGKSCVSRRGLFLEDKMAEQIWAGEGFALKGKSASKWLAYYMGIRAAVFDDWTRKQMMLNPEAVVLHLGCGLDSRCLRVGDGGQRWFDVDFPEVIAERTRYFSESENYQMIPGDLRENDWLGRIPAQQDAIVVMEGVSMYLTPEALQGLLVRLSGHFRRVVLLMDCYTTLAANMSKYKNPINDVGVTQVYGLDDPRSIGAGELAFRKELELTPRRYIQELKGAERIIFSKLYAGGFSRKLYRLYAFSSR